MKIFSVSRAASLVQACTRPFVYFSAQTRSQTDLRIRMASTNSSRPAADAFEGEEADAALPASNVNDPHPWHERFDISKDQPVYKRYLTVYDRLVTFTPDVGEAHSLHYDVVGHPNCSFCFAVAIPFHPATETAPAQVTLVREYAQGPNILMYCFPSGGFDKRKHTDLRQCAEVEMAEEAMLVGGEVVSLFPEDHPGQSELKWSCNTFKPFLIIDPQPAPSGHAATRDAEEHTIEVLRVSIPELRRLIAGGQVMLPSVFAFFLAQDVLKDRQLL
ncbi:hypothetical protein Vafri_4597 [Volvox africanus]|uniref:Nudix hydrolase domain-containing protein n=1 Tax=Volvox africanus TaxID=51714 RepID=A0A8J4AYT8_9CHLO|nr:hypothetical protein Vafri_4597 [Volvox africanus]